MTSDNQLTQAQQADVEQVDAIVRRARDAQAEYGAACDQARYDRAAYAAAWALMEPGRNAELSEMAVATTGLGNVNDKVKKNHRKTLGLLRDIRDVKTCGVINSDPETGITEIARPIGVVGAVVPSTNPAATPTNNIINALKCGNAIVLSPSPKGAAVCETLINYIHAEFAKINENCDLVQMVPAPSSKIKTQRTLETTDLVVVTGSQDNVRRAYSSGTPALGVGAGNATVIIDETADLHDAAQKITASKTFDNATSCSSENVLIVLDAVHDQFVAALDEAGGKLLDAEDTGKVKQALFQRGHLNREMIAKDIDQFLQVAGIEVESKVRFVVLPASGIGADFPESGEKLSLSVALYRARDFAHASALAEEILNYQGAGHSVGLHTDISAGHERATSLGLTLPACRIIVNQAHCFATGGSFDNGMPFSLSMGCGSWGGNSIDDNISHTHFMNTTRVVLPVASDEPTVDEVFAGYWQEAGR